MSRFSTPAENFGRNLGVAVQNKCESEGTWLVGLTTVAATVAAARA